MSKKREGATSLAKSDTPNACRLETRDDASLRIDGQPVDVWAPAAPTGSADR